MVLYAPALVDQHAQIPTVQVVVQIRAHLLVGLPALQIVQTIAPADARVIVKELALLLAKKIHAD